MHQPFETLEHFPPRGWPGHLNFPLPAAKVNVELPHPHMTHTHTPVIAKRNKGWQIMMIVGKNTWISVLLSQHLQTLAEEGKWRLDLKTLQLEVTKCETKNTVFWSFSRLTKSLQVSFFISTILLPKLHQKLLNNWATYMGKNKTSLMKSSYKRHKNVFTP